jgi:hypothetical protein
LLIFIFNENEIKKIVFNGKNVHDEVFMGFNDVSIEYSKYLTEKSTKL